MFLYSQNLHQDLQQNVNPTKAEGYSQDPFVVRRASEWREDRSPGL